MDKNRTNPAGYIYGPVPSRRLGLSLGIDIVPSKICTLDCVYCQIGRTTEKSTVRRDFFDLSAVLDELRLRLAEGGRIDYITIGGSGEPTLNSQLGALIDGIRSLTAIPIAIITNGTLLCRPDVRAECGKANLVIPSLDAGDTATFEAVNRPDPDINIEKLVSGLALFREEFSGQIWLEIFLIEGINTTPDQIEKIAAHVRRIRPDRVQLNSAVRPAAEKGIEAISRERLEAIARQMGANCEIIGAAPEARTDSNAHRTGEDVLSMLKRRPCSLDDICTGLGIHPHEAAKHLGALLEQGQVVAESRGETLYYRSIDAL